MDFELHPAITLRPRSFNVLVAPREMLIQAFDKNLNLQRFKVLYVAGNYSGILATWTTDSRPWRFAGPSLPSSS
jgi:hypothetical protein